MSIIFNGFENKAKYGAGYGYGYGYGYGPYSNGYTDEEKPRHFYDAIKKNYKQKEKNNSRIFKLIERVVKTY
jgi:hypothetical protein